jgi:hypothetical protein
MTERHANINSQLLEFRFKPNPEFLDIRGKLAEELSDQLSFEHWNIIDNRVDVFKKDSVLRAFVGFRNAGFSSMCSPTRNYFFDNCSKFINKLFSYEIFEKGLEIQRIGFKTSFCNSYDGTFEDLKDRIFSRYMILSDGTKNVHDQSAKTVDIAINLILKDKFGNFATTCGPMIKDQLKEYFPGEKELPDIGLFYDIDYWIKPEKIIKGEEINKKIKEFSFSEWEINEKLKELVLK